MIEKLRGIYRNQSIFVKVLTGYLVLSLCLIAVTSGVSGLLLRRYTSAVYIGNIRDKAQVVSDILSQREGDISCEVLRDMERLSGMRVVLIDKNGTARIISRGSEPMGGEPPETFEYMTITGNEDRAIAESILLEGRTEAGIEYMNIVGSRVIFAGTPVFDAQKQVKSAVFLYQEVRSLRGITASTAQMIAISLVTASLISMALAFVMSRRITRPLSALTQSARYIAQGHYGEVVQATEENEIGELGRSLNDMSARLSQTIFDLQNEKAKLEQIISNIGEGIVAVNKDGEIIHRNSAALELLEIGRSQEPGDSHRQHLLDMLSAAMNDRERAETRWLSESGRTIRARVWPIMNGDEIIGAVGLLSDVSEYDRLEQMRRDYVANVSHELRTPLTGIQGMVEPLMDGYIETEEERMDCYRIIYQETLRLEKLIGEMLDMSRLQSGRLTVELEPMDIVGIMRGAVRRMRERAVQCGVDLRVDEAQEELPMVMGNEDRIMQVLMILMDNALSFTPSGGSVTLYARREKEKVYVGVRDTGSGIDPADMPYIWERFYKADKSRMRTTGTGLGLSIAKLVCELMNGSISASSEPGRGATFEFTLNLYREEE